MKNTVSIKTKTKSIHDESVAMTQFLDAMFRVPDVPETAEIRDLPVNRAEPHLKEISQEVAAEVTELENDADIVANKKNEQIWFEQDFQGMLVDLGALKLTLPLIEVDSVVNIPDELNELPGQTDWIMGVFQHQGKTIKVVDTSQLVVPGKIIRDIEYHQVVIIDGNWGLACKSVSEVINVRKNEVHWREERGRRKWLAGTLIEKMSGLVDIKEFIVRLDNETVGEMV